MIYILSIYEQYKEKVIIPMLAKNPNNVYSDMFFITGLGKGHPNNMTIMVIGQNARIETKFHSESLSNQQNYYNGYLEMQLYGVNNGHKRNTSPFWKFISDLKFHEYEVIWNNIDKINRIENGKFKDATEGDELIMNSAYGEDNKTLLEREIEFFNPDILLFLTGPHYIKSMSSSLQIDESVLSGMKPSRNETIVDLTSTLNIGVKAFWTYHPSYLNRTSGFSEVIEYINKMTA